MTNTLSGRLSIKRFHATARFLSIRTKFLIRTFTTKTLFVLMASYPSYASAQAASTSSTKISSTNTQHVKVYSDPLYGHGLLNLSSKNVEKSSVSAPWMKMQTPTADAFSLISLLPGANVAATDPTGLSAQDSISVRGLDGTEVGYLLEGMPMNDLAGNTGTATQFADTENLQTISLQQGSTNISDPLLTGAGGVVSMSFINPNDKFKTQGAITIGNHNELREYVRMDTGYIGNTGIKGFASFSNTSANLWHGPGENERKHVDFKFTKEFGQRATVSLVGSFNRGNTGYYQPEGSDINKYGHGNHLSSTFGPNQDGRVNYWKSWQDREQTIYVGLPINVKLNKHFSVDALAYGQRAFGNWPWGNTAFDGPVYQGTQEVPNLINPTNNNSDVVRADSTQTTSRAGLLLTLHANYKHHKVSLGWWGDIGHDIEKSPFAPIGSDGTASDGWGLHKGSHLETPNGQELLSSGFATRSYVNTVFISDDIDYGKNHFSIGFKELWQTDHGHNKIPNLQKTVHHNFSIPLPRASFSREVTDHDNFFIHVSTNFKTPNFSSFYYSTDPDNGARGNPLAGSLKPEYSVEEQVGWQHHGKYLGFSATFFNYNFWHRQFTTMLNYGNDRYYSTYTNAGAQTSRGVDLEASFKKIYGFSPYFSFEYVDAKVDSNLPYGSSNGTNTQISYASTKGKRPVNTPSILLGAGLTYEYKGFYAFFSAHYTGAQYGTYTNNSKIPGYVTENLGAGYKASSIGYLDTPTIKLSIVNLSDRHYFSGAAYPQLGNDSNQPASYYLAGGTAVTGTIQAGF